MAADQTHVRASVLIVEGDSISRAALRWLLEDLGFEAVAVSDLAGARQAIARKTPEILILDLNLPDGDGIDLLAEIRAARSAVVVAIVTGITNSLKLHEVTALKPDALFGKPIDIDDFDNWLVKQLANFALASTGKRTLQNAAA
jgi:DNA-binding response OmpR family regulator